ncbi:uncharacterized protein LAESUDRAFT_765140 [Laetiporus sulphureus 93-53]|uniref:Uncharacterized protein n=1 Tax=Laetiporus sulphureus 93-53 TaxID=1314785 RepID=A0A165AXY1_9APHY|nr:uncharacterized protein LAESUDRAFT_765140 [Laetiporus sulphureus 93-53]KZS99868.1 hypothetical protein LAESUDRAFT_765140 [Laetiporus sulphureus 93-53]
MGDPATLLSSQCPATPVTSSCKTADSKDAVMGVIYFAWEALCEAEPLNPAVDFEFLIHEVLSALELSPPSVTEAFAHTPSNTEEVTASNSLTTSTGTDDTLLSVALASFFVVAMPVTASAALGDPVPTFEFQARAANLVAIDPPFNSDLAAMEVDPPLASMFNKPPSVKGSETIELSSND